jgi:hypothetical protein
MSPLQRGVQDVLDRLVRSGAEIGLQVAVFRHGELAMIAGGVPNVGERGAGSGRRMRMVIAAGST